MSALQGRAYETVVRLQVEGPYGLLPVLGVLPEQAAVSMRRTGTYEFEIKTLDEDNWKDLGNGYYAVVWGESNTGSLGEFYYILETTGAVPFSYIEGSFSIEPVPLSVLIAPGKCVISGNIVDIGGDVGTESWINFRIAKTPSVAGTSIVEGKLLRTVPDVFGNFSVVLLRGKKVIVEIPQSGLKHTITVPDQETANLVDILPPIID